MKAILKGLLSTFLSKRPSLGMRPDCGRKNGENPAASLNGRNEKEKPRKKEKKVEKKERSLNMHRYYI
jgi:hypothetical protein